MATYLCDDGNAEIRIDADTPRDAAQAYVDDGDWGEITEPITIRVYVTEEPRDGAGPKREAIDITLDPPEPECEAAEHDWQSPHDVLGGDRGNPGVWGHGSGVIIEQVCAVCGTYRIIDTDAQDRDGGTMRSVTYRDADAQSLAWVTR